MENTPTRFVVKGFEAKTAWERVRLFFESYTSRYAVRPQGRGELVSNRDTNDSYIYEVRKSPAKDGLSFEVACYERIPSKTGAYSARLNAQNLARFIVEGTLELTLLQRGRP